MSEMRWFKMVFDPITSCLMHVQALLKSFHGFVPRMCVDGSGDRAEGGSGRAQIDLDTVEGKEES